MKKQLKKGKNDTKWEARMKKKQCKNKGVDSKFHVLLFKT